MWAGREVLTSLKHIDISPLSWKHSYFVMVTYYFLNCFKLCNYWYQDRVIWHLQPWHQKTKKIWQFCMMIKGAPLLFLISLQGASPVTEILRPFCPAGLWRVAPFFAGVPLKAEIWLPAVIYFLSVYYLSEEKTVLLLLYATWLMLKR